MKYGHIITAVGLLVKAQEFHKKAAAEYSRLFNESFRGRPKFEKLEYTPLQVLYQELAQRHLAQSFLFDQDLVRYRELVDIEDIDPQEVPCSEKIVPTEVFYFPQDVPPTGL